MAKVSIDFSKFSKEISKLKNGLIDMQKLFKNIADLELSQTLQRYKAGTDPDGKKWEDPFTIRRGRGPETGSGKFSTKRGWDYVVAANYKATPPGYRFFSKALGDKTLIDTGTMLRSIGRFYDKDSAIVGTNISYAKKHQEGDGVKQRRFIGINKKTYDNIDNAMEAYLRGLLK